MNFSIQVNGIKTIQDINNYWSNENYIQLLDEFNFPEAEKLKPEQLREMLDMAITDFEPNESAAILLKYLLGEVLSEGQIQNMSHEMSDGSETKSHADISLHYPLFNINQLLFKAYNGKFPNLKATKLEMELKFDDIASSDITKEYALKAISKLLNDHSLLHRLYEEPLNGSTAFDDAENIIWELNPLGSDKFTVITSEQWLDKNDFVADTISDTIAIFEEDEE